MDEARLLEPVGQALERYRARCNERAAADAIRRRVAMLTPREVEVMQLVVAGLPNKTIGDRLGVTEKTVKVHRGRVMEKMGAKSVADLVRECAVVGMRLNG